MKLNDHLDSLENIYNRNIDEAQSDVDLSFSLLIKNMEIFLKDYHSHNKRIQEYNDLVDQREKLEAK